MIEYTPIIAMSGAASMAAGIISSVATYYSMQAAADASKYTALSEFSAARERGEQAQYEAELQRREARRLIGRQRAAASKSGVSLEGSFLNVQQDTAIQAELDALAALYTGQVDANRSASRGILARAQTQSQTAGAWLSLGSSLLGGASSAASAASSAGDGAGFS